MSTSYTPDRIFNGTYGEVWLDGTYLPQATALEAKASFDKQEVNQARVPGKGYKIVGLDGKGTLKMNKIDSTFINILGPEMKSLKTSVDDPDAYGAERVMLTGVVFDELTLADWELKKLQEESVAFTFTGWELMDTVE